MKIEYIYPDPDDDNNNLKKLITKNRRDENLGCLILILITLGALFIFLTVLPVILLVLGYAILFLSVYIIYKAYLEAPVLNLIQKLKSRHK